jgi:hypothetical protein
MTTSSSEMSQMSVFDVYFLRNIQCDCQILINYRIQPTTRMTIGGEGYIR